VKIRTLVVACLAFQITAGHTVAQDDSVFIAFGDSITLAEPRFDEQRRMGYVGRLQSKLRGTDPDATVHNFGRNSETTAEGLSRLSFVLQTPSDAIIIMEGTNDITDVADGLISFESVGSNLAAMGSRAGSAGRHVYYATVIPRPPWARRDKTNLLTFALAREIRGIAFRQQRELVDPFDVLRHIPGAYDALYHTGTDSVGHPNAAGFSVMADAFFDSVRGVDSQGPVPAEFLPVPGSSPTIKPANDIEILLYDFGEGLDTSNATITINGIPVATDSSGNSNQLTLTHDTTKASLGCYARIGVQASDLADPPNVSDHAYWEFRVEGGQLLNSDLDKSCRVDGADMLFVAYGFGSQDGQSRYTKFADLNQDGKIDGMDLAMIAADFGRTSS